MMRDVELYRKAGGGRNGWGFKHPRIRCGVDKSSSGCYCRLISSISNRRAAVIAANGRIKPEA